MKLPIPLYKEQQQQSRLSVKRLAGTASSSGGWNNAKSSGTETAKQNRLRYSICSACMRFALSGKSQQKEIWSKVFSMMVMAAVVCSSGNRETETMKVVTCAQWATLASSPLPVSTREQCTRIMSKYICSSTWFAKCLAAWGPGNQGKIADGQERKSKAIPHCFLDRTQDQLFLTLYRMSGSLTDLSNANRYSSLLL